MYRLLQQVFHGHSSVMQQEQCLARLRVLTLALTPTLTLLAGLFALDEALHVLNAALQNGQLVQLLAATGRDHLLEGVEAGVHLVPPLALDGRVGCASRGVSAAALLGGGLLLDHAAVAHGC